MNFKNKKEKKENLLTLEEKVYRNIKRAKTQQIILGSVQAAGVLATALLFPNILKTFGHNLIKNKLMNKKRALVSARKSLLENKMIKVENGHYKITPLGTSALNYCIINKNLKKQKKWDGKWRVLIFDIPESRKYLRDKVRLTLLSLEFIRLQDSVWVFPYPCEETIALMKVDFKVGKDLLYMIVDQIENDKWLKEEFGISDD